MSMNHEMYRAMKEILGDGYIKEYYEQAAEDFIQIAEHYLAEQAKRYESEIERPKGVQPQLPPFPGTGSGLPRYGVKWNGPTQPLTVPMDDGYWTPYHLAEKALKEQLEDSGGK